ncbi:head decoration protein [Desulforegula conservatrix]|uniref:head decoration protein n=1 Tax=Desulforegula conservatrix TaxID=153026 RepID=UPI0003FA686C|nr:head decoration protein [Desulforegula conservatrix]
MPLVTYTQDEKAFVAKDNPVRIKKTIASGADLVQGTILGRVTASGKLKAYASGSSDGSQVPVAVLLEVAAAASADVDAVVGFAGVYVERNMTGLDAAAKLALEPKGIYFV